MKLSELGFLGIECPIVDILDFPVLGSGAGDWMLDLFPKLRVFATSPKFRLKVEHDKEVLIAPCSRVLVALGLVNRALQLSFLIAAVAGAAVLKDGGVLFASVVDVLVEKVNAGEALVFWRAELANELQD